MSTSVPEQVFAETTIKFGHGGEVSIKLSTSASGRFTKDRLEEVFSEIAEGLANELHCISHDCSPNMSDQSVSDSRDFSLVIMETEFVAEVYVSIGEFAIPFENAYFVVQAWLYMGLLQQVGEDVKSTTGITTRGDESQQGLYQRLLLGGQGIAISLS